MEFLTRLQSLILKWRTPLQWGVLVIVAAYFTARSVNLLVSSVFFPLEVRTSDPSATARMDTQVREFESRRVRQRNLFDSSAREPRPPEPVQPEIDQTQLVRSTINAELLGTIVFENARFSVALIQDRSRNATSYLAVGDQIQNARLHRIERFRVILERSGRMEYMEVSGSTGDSTPTPATRVLRPRAPASEGIRETGDGEFEIEGSFLDAQLNDLPTLLRSALAQPVTSGGQIDGFRITQIRPGSVYDQLGLQNGDVIRAVNGDRLDSPQKGMQLFSTLRNQKRISIDIERGGSRLNYNYDIR